MRAPLLPTAAALISLTLPSAEAASVSLVYQDGVDGYGGTRDTNVTAEDSANSSDWGAREFFEADADERVQDDTGESFVDGSVVQGLLRFEGLVGSAPDQIPPGSTIESAQLTVFVDNATAEGAIVAFNRILGPDQGSSDADNSAVTLAPSRLELDIWSENSSYGGLGGSLRPVPLPAEPGRAEFLAPPVEVGATATLAVGNEAVASPEPSARSPQDGILPLSATGVSGVFATIDVTTAVQAWADGAVNAGWVITNNSADGIIFRSREAELQFRPRLEVQTVPEPSSAIVLLSAIVIMASPRRE